MAGEGRIPEGIYKGKLIKVSEMQETTDKGTPFFNVECEVTEDSGYKGRSVNWIAYLGDTSRVRSFQALLGSGWNGEFDGKWTGLGKEEQQLDIRWESYTPDASEKDPNPKERTVARVAFVNSGGAMGMRGKPIEDAKKKSLLESFGADLMRAKTGSVETDTAADGSKVDAGGNLTKGGKKLF